MDDIESLPYKLESLGQQCLFQSRTEDALSKACELGGNEVSIDAWQWQTAQETYVSHRC